MRAHGIEGAKRRGKRIRNHHAGQRCAAAG